MREARFTDAGVELVEAEPRPLRPGWVRLRVEACGICGSDLHMLHRQHPVPDWLVPGHEIVGVPLEGPAHLEDALYAVEPRVWCGHCEFCLRGSRHLCSSGTLLGVGRNGGLAETVDTPHASLHRVPDQVGALAASLSEPLAVCVRATNLARLTPDSRVLVLGAGSIGLLTALLARDRVDRIAITARYPHQQEIAKQWGFVPLAETEADAWAQDNGPDVVIETVGGLAGTLDDSVRLCRPGGRIVMLGVFAGERPVNALALMLKELTLIGSNTYASSERGSEFGTAVDWLGRYPAELASAQTHQFALSDVARAFECAADKRSGAIKVTVLADS
jgi:threonine dehydrogenase-like Zn-dependent dehydrogenase